jgi:DNA polymerase III epsilon subunit-like protein
MKIVFFDVETTGLPISWKESYSNIYNWPYIIQLAYVVSNDKKEFSIKQDSILKPDGFKISSESTEVHGISNEQALIQGCNRKEVLENFASIITDANYIVAHNANFDVNVLRCEFLRNNIEDPFQKDLSIICTMKKSTNFCKIPSEFVNYKWPSLQELYYKLFEKHFNDAHNAKHDVMATFECFWELVIIGVISNTSIKSVQKNIFGRDYLFTFFKERNDLFYELISRHYPLNEKLLSAFENQLDWYNVSCNIHIQWDINLIEKFYNKWDIDLDYYYSNGPDSIKWYGLSANPNLPWSIELIRKYKEKFAFKYLGEECSLGELSTNANLPWSYDLINAFIDNWDWRVLSESSFLPWSRRLIKKYIDKWDWSLLSKNESLPWSISLICKFQDFWYLTSINEMILKGKIGITSKEVIKAYFEDEISIENIAYLPLNEKFIDLAIDSWDFNWHIFSNYGIVSWSNKIVKKYRHKISGSVSFESNNNLYWTLDLLREFESSLVWCHLANNENVEFFNKFEHRIEFEENLYDPYKIDWNYLKRNKGIIWDDLLIDNFHDNLINDEVFWNGLSAGILELKWSDEIIDKYYYNWNWGFLSRNENLCWSEELILKYEDNWDWGCLSSNSAIIWNDRLIKDCINNLYESDTYGASRLLIKCSDEEFVFNFLKNNTKAECCSYDKLWTACNKELYDDFIIEVFNEIK